MTGHPAGQATEARCLLSLPYPGDTTAHALRIAEAQVCAILAVVNAIEALTRQIAGNAPSTSSDEHSEV